MTIIYEWRLKANLENNRKIPIRKTFPLPILFEFVDTEPLGLGESLSGVEDKRWLLLDDGCCISVFCINTSLNLNYAIYNKIIFFHTFFILIFFLLSSCRKKITFNFNLIDIDYSLRLISTRNSCFVEISLEIIMFAYLFIILQQFYYKLLK